MRDGIRDGIRGLIFDKDGTLFDFNATWSAWCHGFILGLAEGDPTRAALLADRLGYDIETRRFLKASPLIAGTMEIVVEAARGIRPDFGDANLRRHIVESTTAAPQVEAAPLAALLDRLRDAGMVLGVATNDSEEPARAHLERAGVLDRFAFIAGYDSGHGAKPTPGMLLAFCAATGLPPGACAMIGDSTHDLSSGRAAGMTTIAVLTGPATAEDLEPHADVVLPDIGALPAWLGLPD